MLITGIITHKNADATLADLRGPYLSRAPENEPFPYCKFTLMDGPDIEYTFGTTYVEPAWVMFEIVTDDQDQLVALTQAFCDTFDNASFSVDDGELMSCLRLGAPKVLDDGIGSGGTSVFRSIVDYQFKTSKTLPR